MKKFISIVCVMITCVFGLTACGGEANYTEYEQGKLDNAMQLAVSRVIPSFEEFKDEELKEIVFEYTPEEVEYLVENGVGFAADGYAYLTAIESFTSTYETIGEVVAIGEPTAEIDDKQIIVYVPVQGEKKNAEAEIIFSNDMFYRMESAALNLEEGMGELMQKAALNTLIGMGTVFVVLILICLIISCFSVIPKIQAKFSKKKEEEKAVQTAGVDNAVAQIVEQEESVEEADDLELVAVIAAAIAASEGAVSTDGFVVRSIRKRR